MRTGSSAASRSCRISGGARTSVPHPAAGPATRDGRRITLSDDTSKLLASLEGWRDESERKKTATRVRDAAKTRFERGYVVGGRVYGYKNERLPGVKGAARLVVNEDQAQIVRRIFRMAADGFGLSRLAQQLNAEGIPRLRVEGKSVPMNSGR